MNRPTAACLIVLAFVASGCLTNPDVSEMAEGHEWPPIGLGLDMPDMLPDPGPFIEGEEVFVLEEFLRQEGRQILRECNREGVFERVVEEMISMQRHAEAVHLLLENCYDYGGDQDLAEHAMRQGTERETFDDLSLQARLAVNGAWAHISDHAGPGTPAEAQFMFFLMKSMIRSEISVGGAAPDLFERYINGSSAIPVTLSSAYLNLVSPMVVSEAVIKAVDRYPWTDPPCTSPDIDNLTHQIQAKIHRSLELAEFYGHDVPDEDGFTNSRYHSLITWFIPEFELARDSAWWPLLLSHNVSMTARLAYWESFTAPAWPSFEEAEFMLAQFRNETRSMRTENSLLRHITYFSNETHQKGHDWDTDIEFGPPRFISLMTLEWPFKDLDCPGQESSGTGNSG